MAIIASGKGEINLKDITVLHSKGVAIEAFSRRRAFIDFVFYIIMILWILALVFYSLMGIRLHLIESLESQANSHFERVKKLLMRKRPFYLSKEKWLGIRQKALEKLAISSIFDIDDLSETNVYRILCDDIPPYLSPDEWDMLRTKANSEFEHDFSRSINLAWKSERTLALIRLMRPKHISEGKWLRLKEKAQERFLELKRQKLKSLNVEEFQNLLKEEMPEGVEPSIWHEYIAAVQKKYCEEIQINIQSSFEPNEFLARQDISLLPAEMSERCTKAAYRCGIALLPDVRQLDEAEAFLKITKPIWLKDHDNNKYRQSAEKTLKLERMRTEFEEKSASLEKNINKVTLQLRIIDEVLSDPSALEKIEDYNNKFAPGNFANLKKVAELIIQSKGKS